MWTWIHCEVTTLCLRVSTQFHSPWLASEREVVSVNFYYFVCSADGLEYSYKITLAK